VTALGRRAPKEVPAERRRDLIARRVKRFFSLWMAGDIVKTGPAFQALVSLILDARRAITCTPSIYFRPSAAEAAAGIEA